MKMRKKKTVENIRNVTWILIEEMKLLDTLFRLKFSRLMVALSGKMFWFLVDGWWESIFFQFSSAAGWGKGKVRVLLNEINDSVVQRTIFVIFFVFGEFGVKSVKLGWTYFVKIDESVPKPIPVDIVNWCKCLFKSSTRVVTSCFGICNADNTLKVD